MKKRRADEALVSDLGLESVALARALIMEGRVMAGDRKILRPSELLKHDDVLRVRGELDAYVSRGAHKLKKALEVFGIDLNGRMCVDVGASTGGFTDVMLRAGAKRVYSVDVGYNLLVLPAALGVLADENQGFVALVKPQFEAGKDEVGETGVVRDRAVHEKVLKDITGFIPTLGWGVAGLDYSPIRGPEGNIEFLLYLKQYDKSTNFLRDISIDVTINRAYDNFFKSVSGGL